MGKTILEEAVLEVKQIKEAAEKAAMEKLANAMPKEFDKFLKDELNKSTIKESTNVGDKKESQKINESFMDATEEPTLEEKLASEEQPCCDDEVLDMTNLSLDDVEAAYNDASSEDEIEVVDDSGMESQSDVISDDMMKDIEEELTQMGDASEEMVSDDVVVGDNSQVEESNTSDPYEFMKKMHEELSGAIKAIEEKLSVEGYQSEFDGKMSEMYGEGFKESIGEQRYNEMFEMYKSKKMEEVKKAGVTEAAPVADEKKEEVSEVVAPEGHEEGKEVDEAHGISLANNKKVNGNKAPQLDNKNYAKNKVRSAVQESKKLTSLLEENKKLTKKLNENKAKANQLNDVVNQYRTALEKYRKQLTEMAVFNNNLAHVNSILLSEEFTLTSGEKKNIIDQFKKVSTLEESEKKYKEVISEISKKKTVNESIEDKLTDSIQPSSANVLGNVVENTAYVNEHVNKIKKLMDYGRKKK
jgi:hypothetical protein